ncbi:MAG TPA: serine protease, partial [Candidatus Limnocylindrales bacterium]|nr:serine protease [Candidatus Limnocylindrales bacterium]
MSTRVRMPVSRVRPHLILLAVVALTVLSFSHARAASILPFKSDEATLLLGVDSARTSVVTMVAMPAPDPRHRPDRPLRRLIGTGVVLNPHRILTTASMALAGGSYNVLLGDGLKREARLRGVDRESNIALFAVEGEPLSPLREASPQSVAPGSWVAVIANVTVTRPQITLGQVVGRGERVDFPYSGEIVEIEASTNPGSSGGAVLNEAGEWVAIVVGRAGAAPPRSPASNVVEPDGPDNKQATDL